MNEFPTSTVGKDVEGIVPMILSPHGVAGAVGADNPFLSGFGDGVWLDAFGRLRTSSPTTLFSSTQRYDSDPLRVENYTVGTATATYNQAASSTLLSTAAATAGNRALRQTKTYWIYQPGKSQTVFITGTLRKGAAPTGGSFAGIGYYDDDNGVYFRDDANGLSVVRRSSVSGSVVETIIPQAQWDDPMDGTGLSGLILDPTKEQIFAIDLQWLGVGRVRFGLDIDGVLVDIHSLMHANMTTSVYMQTATLPVRYEVNNVTTGSTTQVEALCLVVQSEGGTINSPGLSFECDDSGTPKTAANSAALTPIISIRCQDTWNGLKFRGHITRFTLNLLALLNPVYWEWTWNATLTGASFSPVNTSSGAEFDTSATAYTGGIPITSGYTASSGQGSNVLGMTATGAPESLILSRTYANTRDVLTLAARGLGGAATVYCALNYEERR